MERSTAKACPALLGTEPTQNFTQPAGLKSVEVCAISGLLPPSTAQLGKELFIGRHRATEYCTVHRVERVNRETGRWPPLARRPSLSRSGCTRSIPPRRPDGARTGYPQPPTKLDEIMAVARPAASDPELTRRWGLRRRHSSDPGQCQGGRFCLLTGSSSARGSTPPPEPDRRRPLQPGRQHVLEFWMCLVSRMASIPCS